jgi:hypothetical protein
MFTIDLLKGTGKPPQSHPLWAAGTTLAFVALAVVAALDGIRYLQDGTLLAGQKRSISYYTEEIYKLREVAEAIDATQRRRAEIDAALAEVNKALSYHGTWSPIIAIVAQNTPPDLVISDIMAKREEQGVGDKLRYNYTMMLGMVSPSGGAAVEQYVRTLRLALPLLPGPDSIRIISQRQQTIGGQPMQYYVVQCQLKMKERP